jgi:hypothetical protein
VTRSCGLSGRSRNRVNNGQWDAFAASLSGLPPEQLRRAEAEITKLIVKLGERTQLRRS